MAGPVEGPQTGNRLVGAAMAGGDDEEFVLQVLPGDPHLLGLDVDLLGLADNARDSRGVQRRLQWKRDLLQRLLAHGDPGQRRDEVEAVVSRHDGDVDLPAGSARRSSCAAVNPPNEPPRMTIRCFLPWPMIKPPSLGARWAARSPRARPTTA